MISAPKLTTRAMPSSGTSAERTEAAPATAPATFASIDGTTKVSGFLTEPDRYRHLLDNRHNGPLIARGSGLSYVAASMGAGVLSVGMRCFDRILAFDGENGILEVEAGARLDGVLQCLLDRGYMLPVVPGHPAITIGGCIACDVHGKNPVRDRTFGAHVIALDLWHPRLGLRRIKSGTAAFEATCGGYGLTGIIVAATMRARKLGGSVARIALTRVRDLDEAQAILSEKAESADLLYSWHDWSRPGGSSGYVVEGAIIPATGGVRPRPRTSPQLKRGRQLALMNRLTIPLFNALYGLKLAREDRTVTPLDEVLFPLARFGFYYRLFGAGLIEHQVLVPNAMWSRYWTALDRLFREYGVRPVVSSLKLFRGPRTGIVFSGDGVALTFDVVNNARSRALLAKLDGLDCDVGALTNPAKDLRLTAEVFRRQTPGIDVFRSQRAALDPDELFRSALSLRLSL